MSEETKNLTPPSPLPPPCPPLSGGEQFTPECHLPASAPVSGGATTCANAVTSPPDKGGPGGVNGPAETLIWQRILSHRQFQGLKSHRQKPIGPYIADFYCPELHLVIEIDGESHGLQAGYDAFRTETLNHLGLRVLRYTNRDVLSNPEGVFADLAGHLHETPS